MRVKWVKYVKPIKPDLMEVVSKWQCDFFFFFYSYFSSNFDLFQKKINIFRIDKGYDTLVVHLSF